MNFLKKNLTTLIIVLATFVLAAVAIFTAIKLYETRQTSVAPNAPQSKPAAAALPTTAAAVQTSCQALAFTLVTAPTATPVLQCGSSCTGPSDCPSGMTCYVGVCRNTSCEQNSNCICATATATPTPTPTAGIPNSCGGTCGSDANCQSGMKCYITSGTSGFCRNPQCSTSTNCLCATAAPTTAPLATVTPKPTLAPTLPVSGSVTPTILGLGGGAILLLIAITLAL